MAAGGTQRTFIEVLKFYNKMYGEDYYDCR